MIKHRTLQIIILIALASLPFTSKSASYSYTFTTKTWSSFGTQTINGVSWTASGSNGNYFGYDNNKGQQFGSTNNPETYVSLLTNSIQQTITAIKVTTSGASGIAGTISVSVGDTQFSTANGVSQSISSTSTAYTFTGSSAGITKIYWSQTSSKAIYIKSIEITYKEDPPAITTTTLTGNYGNSFTGQLIATNGATSFNILSGSLPNGLQLNSSTGVISGTPLQLGVFSLNAQASNNYGTGAATTINIEILKGDQTITFEQPDEATNLDTPYALNAFSSSDLPISYSSSNTEIAEISGNKISILGIGTTNITAIQDGNEFYNAATPVTRVLTVVQWVAPSLSLTETTQANFTTQINNTDATTMYIAGQNLSKDIDLTLSGTNADQFSLSRAIIPTNSATAENTLLTIYYSPTTTGTHFATIKLSSEGATDFTQTLIGTTNGVITDNSQLLSTRAIYNIGHTLFYTAQKGDQITIYNSTGQIVCSQKALFGTNTLYIPNKGILIIKLANVIQKIVI